MSKEEEKPKIHVDEDWKAQAQAEKARLAEETAKEAAETAQRGPIPPASFTLLVISLATQARMCMGDIGAGQEDEKHVDLELAKHNIDLLGILEEKTQENLSEEEKTLLDSALYELRMRYVQMA